MVITLLSVGTFPAPHPRCAPCVAWDSKSTEIEMLVLTPQVFTLSDRIILTVYPGIIQDDLSPVPKPSCYALLFVELLVPILTAWYAN